MEHERRIVVIGGGPAGSAAATVLSRYSGRVTLFERDRFPRDHVGESLLPASMPILEDLGVLPEIERSGFLKKWGATMVWGTNPEPWSWYFRETNRSYPHAYQVSRPQFDALLLENARRNGVAVHERHAVERVVFENECAVGVMVAGEAGAARFEPADFVVDASGQAGLIGRALELRQVDDSFRNLAVYAYYDGAERLPEPDQTNIFIESYQHGWFWNIPLHSGLMSVGAVVDSVAGRDGIREHGLDTYFDRQIAATERTRGMLSAARRVQGPLVIRDWSYVSQRVAGKQWVLAGDAACFIDPLFSTGVHLALSSGVMAAALVRSTLTDPSIAEPAGKVYEQLYYQQYSHFRELARLFYASNRAVESYFWAARRIMRDDSLTPRAAFVRATAGQAPHGYERSVLAHGELPQQFTDEVAELEGERSERAAAFEATYGGERRSLLLNEQPALIAEARLERRPVLGDAEFVWGHVLSTPSWPEGIPVSSLVAWLVTRLDGNHRIATAIEELSARAGVEASTLIGHAAAALRLLYIEGLLKGLATGAARER